MKAKVKERISSRKKYANVGKHKPVSVRGKPVGVLKRKVVNSSKEQVKNGRKPTNTMKSLVKRDRNGHIMKGSCSNGGGRPKGSLSGARISEIRQSISRVELERRKPERKRKFIKWIDHQINKSYDDTTLAVAVLNKIHPTLKSIEQVNLNADLMDDVERTNLCQEYNKRFED